MYIYIFKLHIYIYILVDCILNDFLYNRYKKKFTLKYYLIKILLVILKIFFNVKYEICIYIKSKKY